jgi:hypothetical protein
MRIKLQTGLAMACLLALLGCGDGPRRYEVSGTIKIKGQPVKYGNITFINVAGGLGGGAVIENGKYTIAKSVGLPVGQYRVRLSAPDRLIEGGPPGAPGNDLTGPPPKELFPADYTDEVKTPLKFEVTADGNNVFDHDYVK